jgi:hypothetical protein
VACCGGGGGDESFGFLEAPRELAVNLAFVVDASISDRFQD